MTWSGFGGKGLDLVQASLPAHDIHQSEVFRTRPIRVIHCLLRLLEFPYRGGKNIVSVNRPNEGARQRARLLVALLGKNKRCSGSAGKARLLARWRNSGQRF